MTLSFQTLTGDAITPFIPELAKLRIQVFKEYPYLYEGDLAYEEEYLKDYARAPESCLILALDNGHVVGASTAMPLAKYHPEMQVTFQKHQMAVSDIFYLGESVLLKPYRGQGAGVRFFELREAQATKSGCSIAAFCAVDRDTNHPKRPGDYVPLDAFWKKRGYQKHPELQAHFDWTEIGDTEESPHSLTFWLKALN